MQQSLFLTFVLTVSVASAFGQAERGILSAPTVDAVTTSSLRQEHRQTGGGKDLWDDPLPRGAVARLGTVRSGEAVPVGLRGLPSVRGLCFSPDGRWLATRGEPADPSQPRKIRIWDAQTGKLSRGFAGHDARMISLGFSPDGRFLVAGQPEHGAGLQIWDFQTGRKLRSLDGGRGRFHFLPDGSHIAVVAAFGRNDVVRVHDIQTGKEVQRFVIDPNYKFAFSPDGSKLLTVRTGGRAEMKVIDLRTGKTLQDLVGGKGQPSAFTFSPDGRTVVSASSHRVSRNKYEHRIIVWELLTKKIVYQLTLHTSRILATTFTPDGRFLVTGAADRTVRVWELATGKLSHTFRGHRGPVTCLAMSSDGRFLASGSLDHTVLVWKLDGVRKSFLPREKLTAKAMNQVWDDLGAFAPKDAYKAIGRLTAKNAPQAIVVLKERVTSVLIPAQNKRIHQLLVELDDDDSVVRQRAMRELRKLRRIAKPILLKTIKSTTSAEVRYRVRRILANMKERSRFSQADDRRMLRIISAVESITGPDAEAILQMIVRNFPTQQVVKTARETLRRLKQVRQR